MEKSFFIFDKNRCVGCQACLVACFNENGIQTSGAWKTVYHSNPFHVPDLPLFYLSMSCNHCDEAPCLKNCPANAFYQDENSGAVLHDPGRCIGCNYCSWVCPFDAPKYNRTSGTIEKCHFCHHLIDKGEKPACSSMCPTGALGFGKESDDLSGVPADILRNGNHETSLRLIELRKFHGPQTDISIDAVAASTTDPSRRRLSLRAEWPLLLFSLLSAFMVAAFLLPGTENAGSLAFTAGILAGTISLFHLGNRKRAYRSIFNLSGSWLSREIFFFVLCLVLIMADLFIVKIPRVVMILNMVFLLVSIDMLYLPLQNYWKIGIHPGFVVFSALSGWALFSGHPELFLLLVMIRLLLTLFRLRYDPPELRLFSMINAGLLIIAAGMIFGKLPATGIPVAIAYEVLARIHFYLDLEPVGPMRRGG